MQKVVYRVCKTAADIKRMWDQQRTEAALRGTWMHLQIEPSTQFTRGLQPWQA
jgi:hypothetical protein